MIVERFWERDERALTAVSEKYGSYCAAIAFNIIGNEQAAEEAVQDTLLRLWETIPPNRPQKLRAFIGRVARNIALDAVKAISAKKRGGGEVLSELDELGSFSSDENVEKLAEQHELIAGINDFLGTLSETKRNVFILRYWHCCAVPEISQIVGISAANVSNILKRGRKKLMEYLEKRGLK